MRLAAFTLSLSSGWREEWGGLLHLTDENGGIERTLVPEFNSLVLFNVPRNHLRIGSCLNCPRAQAHNQRVVAERAGMIGN